MSDALSPIYDTTSRERYTMGQNIGTTEVVEQDDLPSSAEVAAEIAAIDREIIDHETGLAEFEKANLAGEDVDFDELPRRRSALDVLRARRQGAKARKQKAVQRERLAVLAELRERILAEDTDDARQLAAAADKFHKAGTEFLRVAKARQERQMAIHAELRKHNVPDHRSPAPTPSPAHGELGLGVEGIAVGRKRLRKIDGPAYLGYLSEAVLRTGEGRGTEEFDKLRSRLAKLDDEVTWRPEAQSYWQGTGGSIYTFDLDGPDELTRRGMRELTEEEALHIWWSDTPVTSA